MVTRKHHSHAKQSNGQSNGQSNDQPPESEQAIVDVVSEVVAEVVSEPQGQDYAKDYAKLEAQIHDLSAALEKGQRKENLLQMQIDQLQARLDDQQDLIGKLQSSMEKTNHLHAELEQAQKMALKLAEANQALIAENQSLKQPPEPPPSALQLSEPPRPDLRNQQEVLRQRQAARLSHPVFPNRPQASEPDVGWVD